MALNLHKWQLKAAYQVVLHCCMERLIKRPAMHAILSSLLHGTRGGSMIGKLVKQIIYNQYDHDHTVPCVTYFTQ